jgi:hypothetical protein
MGKPVVSRKPGLDAVVNVALALVAQVWLLDASAGVPTHRISITSSGLSA